MSFYVGLDLGQAQDPTAICVVEKPEEGDKAPLHVRHLERPELGTYYPDIAERVKGLVRDPSLTQTAYNWTSGLNETRSPELVVDATGVGRPVVDMIRREGLSFVPVLITGGDIEHHENGWYKVPKRNLVSAVQLALQSGRLKIAEELALAATLRKELLNFRIKVNISTAHDSYEAWREGDHDDLVLATALACWKATRPRSVLHLVSSPLYSVGR
jgi:hypothetical protein